MLQGKLNEEKLIDDINSTITDATTGGYKTSDSLLELLGLILLLIIILVAAYYTTRFVAKIKLGKLQHSNFEVIDTYRINQSKALQIVKIGTRYVVIAIGKDSVSFIMELQETELNSIDSEQGEKSNFKQIFEVIRKKQVKVGNHEDEDKTYKD